MVYNNSEQQTQEERYMYKSIMYQFLQNLNQESLEDSVNVLLFFD